MIFSSLSSSSFFCLGIILVILGILGFLISRKFQEQNHKITTMCELVTTMAQDLQMLKMQNAVDKIQHSLHAQSATGGAAVAMGGFHAENAGLDHTLNVYLNDGSNSSHQKIVVSDDEASFEDSEEEEDVDDNSTLEEFEEPVLDDDVEELEEHHLPEEEEEEEDDNIEITEIQDEENEDALSLDNELGGGRVTVIETKHIDLREELDPVVMSPSTEPSIVVNKLQTTASPVPFVSEEDEEEEALLDVPSLSTSSATTGGGGSANHGITKPKKTKQSRSMTAEEANLENLEEFTGDFSKLNVNQLRNVVTQRGLSTHASKLKKTELLQLLGAGTIATASVELGDLVMEL